jgi:phosphatidate cytidylyltransferase
MRQRIISAIIGLVVLAAVLAIIDTVLLNIFVALLSMAALYELLRATGCLKYRGLTALSFMLAVGVAFLATPLGRDVAEYFAPIIIGCFFVLLVNSYGKGSIREAAMAFLFGVFIPLFLNSCVFMRDIHGGRAGAFYLLMSLGSAWWCDTGAYFIGSRYGRRKLAPIVSPNKTVEGAIGGLVFAIVFNQLVALGFYLAAPALGFKAEIDYLLLAAFTPVWAVLGMLGDLSASVIKRQFAVKDYGNIMPGHGGVMDRFDSALFTMPAVFLAASFAPLVRII